MPLLYFLCVWGNRGQRSSVCLLLSLHDKYKLMMLVTLRVYHLRVLFFSHTRSYKDALFLVVTSGKSITTAGLVGLYLAPIVVAFTTTVVSLGCDIPCVS